MVSANDVHLADGAHASVTLGGSNPRSDKSNPTGDMTPARSETAAKVLFAIPATKWTAEGIYVLLRLSRVYWWWWLGSGWPELTAASSAAAAGVRVRSESALQGVRGGVGACYVLQVRCGA